jgi:hypothetical protein
MAQCFYVYSYMVDAAEDKAYLKQHYVIKFVCNFGVDSALNVYCLALLSTTCTLMALHKQENIWRPSKQYLNLWPLPAET